MRMSLISALAGVAVVALSAPAMATAYVAPGTVTVAGEYTPAVNLASNPSTYTANLGMTFEVVGTGGFVPVTGTHGTVNGTIQFSSVAGTTLADSLADFFVFDDGAGGTYNFSLDSVQTLTFSNNPGVASAASLYLLGTTLDSHLGLSATPTSLTLSFNSTGGSPYSTSATLAVPPSGAVPEPATWALALMGFGATGAALRRKPRTSVTFA